MKLFASHDAVKYVESVVRIQSNPVMRTYQGDIAVLARSIKKNTHEQSWGAACLEDMAWASRPRGVGVKRHAQKHRKDWLIYI